MFQIPVVIKMSGLLLLTPSNSSNALPYYALLPNASGHEAYFAYRQTAREGCEEWVEEQQLCVFDPAGYEITIGSAISMTAPSEVELNGAVGNVSKAAGVLVPASLLGSHPSTDGVRGIRARIRLNAGEQTDQCYLARWFFNGNPWAPLGNIVTWQFTADPGDLVLTRRKLADLEAPPETIVVRRPASGPFELFILHVPQKENYSASFLMEARHFNHYYDMLGVAPAGRRPLPVMLRKQPSDCYSSWTQRPGDLVAIHRVSTSPGAPTCLVAGGTPAPPGP
jgi:hypothetical protein